MEQYGSLLTKSFFLRDADTVARNLIGTYCFTIRDGERTGGEIIETEAYDEKDPAAHCFIGEDGRRSYGSYPMLLEGGHAYIYRANPVCLNFVCDKRNFGSAVLIRKIRATEGFELMKRRRDSNDFCSGPSKLCKAMGIGFEFNNLPLTGEPFEIFDRGPSFDAQKIKAKARYKIQESLKKSKVSAELRKSSLEAERNWYLASTLRS